MAFPVVQATNESATTTAGTTHTVSLPASIAAGDLLIVLIAGGGTNALQFGTVTGWTEFLDENVTFGAHAWYRWADGTEGATQNFTSGASSRSAHISYRISGAVNPATQAPEISAVGTGTSNAPNPNTVTPTGGTKDYLWVTFFAVGSTEATDDDTYINNAATNYGALLQKTSGTGGTNVGAILGSSTRTNAASSEDAVWPAASLDASAAWRAFTIAVHPPPTVSAALEVTLANPATTPDVDTDHTVRTRAWASAGSGSLAVRLLEGATERDAWTITLTGSAANDDHGLSTGVAGAITSYNDLRLEYKFSSYSGTCRISQAYLAVPEGSGGATASPGVIALSATVPAVTTQAGSTTSPGVIARTVTVPQANAGGHGSTTPAVIARTVTVPQATPAAGTTTSPAVIARTVTIPAATTQAGATTSPGVIPLTVTVPQATASGGVAGDGTATPAAITNLVAVPQATPLAGSTVSPAVMTFTVNVPAATVSGGGVATPGVIPLTVTIPQATASGSSVGTATPAVITATVTMGAVTKIAGSTAAPAVTALSVTMPAATGSGSRTITPAVIPLTVTMGAAATQTGSAATPNVVALVAGLPAPTLRFGYQTIPAVIQLAVVIGAALASGTPPDPQPRTINLAGAGFTVTVIPATSGDQLVGATYTTTLRET